VSEEPLFIESAITPYRPGEPTRNADGTVATANECLAAGARIIHYHHDFRLNAEDSLAEMIAISKGILAEHPAAVLYPDFIKARTHAEKITHFIPLASAGMIGLLPVDPGSVMFGGYDDEGRPVTATRFGTTFDDAKEAVAVSVETGIGLSIGVYEPGNLRFALAHAAAGTLPPGSMVKLYFGGTHSIYDLGRPAPNFGLPPTKASLDAYLGMLEDTGIAWSAGVIGGPVLDTPLARYALERGGHLRIGTEDAAGLSPATDREMVEAAVALANEVGRPLATSADQLT
jgi:3-keto-5-aminohexanoate cleavage enzyme